MLENYFGTMNATEEDRQRLLAVQAALEIAKASAGAAGGDAGANKLKYDLHNSSEHLQKLADAIQASLKK